MPTIFLRNIHTGVLLIEYADKEQIILFQELRDKKR